MSTTFHNFFINRFRAFYAVTQSWITTASGVPVAGWITAAEAGSRGCRVITGVGGSSSARGVVHVSH